MEEFTYEEIREKALKQGVPDTKLHIGLWAQFNGYVKQRKSRSGKSRYLYIVLQDPTN